MEDTKLCNSCKRELPLSNFYFRKESGKYRSACKECKSVHTKEDIAKRMLSETKVCKHCNISKPISEYNKAGGGKWFQPYCKPCDSERKRQYRFNNLDKVTNKRKEYYNNNKDSILKQNKEYREKNLDKVKERVKKYSIKNAEKIRARSREYGRVNRNKITQNLKSKRALNPDYYKEKAALLRGKRTPEQKAILYEKQRIWRMANKQKIKDQRQKAEVKERTRERNRIYNNIKSATSIEFRILKNLRSRTRFALKKWDTIKSDSTENLLGCTISFFKEYFSSLFIEGMTWELFMNGDIHIDHIIPCISFNLSNEDEQRKCFHYTNLQPLWAIDNLKKGTKIL